VSFRLSCLDFPAPFAPSAACLHSSSSLLHVVHGIPKRASNHFDPHFLPFFRPADTAEQPIHLHDPLSPTRLSPLLLRIFLATSTSSVYAARSFEFFPPFCIGRVCGLSSEHPSTRRSLARRFIFFSLFGMVTSRWFLRLRAVALSFRTCGDNQVGRSFFFPLE